MNIEFFREYCLSLPFVTEDMPYDDTVVAFRLKGKIFAYLSLNRPDLCAMKCDPARAIELREYYKAIEPAWHCNKKYWNDIHFNSDVNEELLCQLILHAYDEVNKKLPKKDRVNEIIANRETSK
ncbi:MAG: MmcQ/YjbR family DNA-binding protein [Bacteroidales bacterium]|nr:MmcQ/YjbR family DNA-binding protein [Bacteroidales bacterium]